VSAILRLSFNIYKVENMNGHRNIFTLMFTFWTWKLSSILSLRPARAERAIICRMAVIPTCWLLSYSESADCSSQCSEWWTSGTVRSLRQQFRMISRRCHQLMNQHSFSNLYGVGLHGRSHRGHGCMSPFIVSKFFCWLRLAIVNWNCAKIFLYFAYLVLI